MTQTLYMNVYRAGFYHRQGKPGHTNIHAGDFFTSALEALANVEYDKGYIGTVGFEMPVPEGATILANPPGSEPTPLRDTRNNPLALMPWHTAPDRQPPVLTAGLLCSLPRDAYENDSLETSEADARPFPAEFMRSERELARIRQLVEESQAEHATAATYRPAHGGYPGRVRL